MEGGGQRRCEGFCQGSLEDVNNQRLWVLDDLCHLHVQRCSARCGHGALLLVSRHIGGILAIFPKGGTLCGSLTVFFGFGHF